MPNPRRTTRPALALLALALPASTALAQTEALSGVVVSAEKIPGGLRLDAGSGPKDFTCQGDKVSSKLKVGSRTINVAGKYLVLTGSTTHAPDLSPG